MGTLLVQTSLAVGVRGLFPAGFGIFFSPPPPRLRDPAEKFSSKAGKMAAVHGIRQLFKRCLAIFLSCLSLLIVNFNVCVPSKKFPTC